MTDDSKTQTPEPPSSDTSDDLDQLRKDRDDYRDLLLRKTAELDNYRKRTEREREALQQSAGADLIREMLPLVDTLERALEADPDASTAAAYRDGVSLIHKQLLDLLEKRGVEPIVAVGTDFDPQIHEAVDTVSDSEGRDGEVVEELQRGYRMKGRLLRPTMVRVAKA